MSVQAMARVLERSSARGTARLVLLVIASHETETRGAFPSVARLAHECGMSVRSVQEAIRRLETSGELRVERNAGPNRTNIYVTTPGGVQISHPADSRADAPPDPADSAPRTVRNNTPLSSRTTSPNVRPEAHDRLGTSSSRTSPHTEPQGFAEFWRIYPRRVGKRKAVEAFARALDRAPLEEILAGARRFRDDPNREDAFTPHPTTWLNRDGWEDDPLPPRRAGPAPLHPVDQAMELARRMRQAEETSEAGPGGGARDADLRGLPWP